MSDFVKYKLQKVIYNVSNRRYWTFFGVSPMGDILKQSHKITKLASEAKRTVFHLDRWMGRGL